MRPVPAVPVDLVRIVGGLLGATWFAQLLLEFDDFTSPQGLIDHRLASELFWYTRISLFQPGVNAQWLQMALVIGGLASASIAIGVKPRLMASVAYVIAVSTYRWNFLVVYLDDGITHLLLFWLMLLPTGYSLTLAGFHRSRWATWEESKRTQVPGLAVRCFLANIALMYVVAGLWKWTSPMWRDGSALYVALQMPISRAPDLWFPGISLLLRPASYFVLLLEPIIPLLMVLRGSHKLKWPLLVATVSLHLGMLLVLRIPYVQIALLAVCPLYFSEEIAGKFAAIPAVARSSEVAQRVGFLGVSAVLFVVLLAAAMLGETTVGEWRAPTRAESPPEDVSTVVLSTGGGGAEHGRTNTSWQNPLYAPLWLIGIAQSYRLFDWVDYRNWDIRYEVRTIQDGRAEPEDPTRLFPLTTRHVLLQTYIHGVTWAPVDPARADELRASLLRRYANRYCGHYRTSGIVEASALVRRISIENSETRPRQREPLMSFSCRNREVVLLNFDGHGG